MRLRVTIATALFTIWSSKCVVLKRHVLRGHGSRGPEQGVMGVIVIALSVSVRVQQVPPSEVDPFIPVHYS